MFFVKITDKDVISKHEEQVLLANHGYPSGYKPKSITEQTNRLRELIPGIGFANEKLADAPLPQFAEGYFAIPRWQSVAPTYGEAVQKVLDLIKKTRNGKFFNIREGQLGPKYMRQFMGKFKAFEKLGEEQKDYDILVVPAQFGLLYRGCCVYAVRDAMDMDATEFVLGAYEVGIMILTHPERLQHDNDLWIDCGGSVYGPDGDQCFFESPVFSFFGGQFCFGTSNLSNYCVQSGSATGFLVPAA